MAPFPAAAAADWHFPWPCVLTAWLCRVPRIWIPWCGRYNRKTPTGFHPIIPFCDQFAYGRGRSQPKARHVSRNDIQPGEIKAFQDAENGNADSQTGLDGEIKFLCVDDFFFNQLEHFTMDGCLDTVDDESRAKAVEKNWNCPDRPVMLQKRVRGPGQRVSGLRYFRQRNDVWRHEMMCPIKPTFQRRGSKRKNVQRGRVAGNNCVALQDGGTVVFVNKLSKKGAFCFGVFTDRFNDQIRTRQTVGQFCRAIDARHDGFRGLVKRASPVHGLKRTAY